MASSDISKKSKGKQGRSKSVKKTTSSVDRTTKSLENIHVSLKPFLKTLAASSDKNQETGETKQAQPQETSKEHEFIQAKAAVAMTIVTLRYMSSRLAGKNPGENQKLERKRALVAYSKLSKKIKELQKEDEEKI